MEGFDFIDGIVQLVSGFPEWAQVVAFLLIAALGMAVRKGVFGFIGLLIYGRKVYRWMQNDEGRAEKIRCRKRGPVPKGYLRELESDEVTDLVKFGKQPIVAS